MKLRIRENTIRLRLKRNEVEQIASGQSIVEQTHFPQSVLTYRLDVVPEGPCLASFGEGSLAIHLPVSAVRQWAESEQVSILAEQTIEGAGVLSMLIEKDFQCLSPGHHRPGEDDEDTYPHPDADSGSGC